MNSNLSKQKIVVGMSGGVDSSVAAVLLKEQGFDVIGVHMKYWSEKDEFSVCDNGIINNDPSRANACCSLDSLEDARRVCAKLDIPLYVVDFKEKFKEKIVDLFIDELKSGFTPNACVVCNREIKFGLLLDYALSIGADGVGTGHYAQVFFDDETKRFGLKKALDDNKDQSYFLSLLSQRQLSKIHLPLGGLTKDYVREIAAANGLVNSKRRDSQDLCFVAADYKSFVKKYTDPIPGNIVLKESGKVIGKHFGLVFYTVGQRKGIATSINEPLFVYSKDFENNNLIVDFAPPVNQNNITLRDFNFLSNNLLKDFVISNEMRDPGEIESGDFSQARIDNNIDFIGRYQGSRNRVEGIQMQDGEMKISFTELKSNFANGQYGAIYQGDVLLGSGKIVNS